MPLTLEEVFGICDDIERKGRVQTLLEKKKNVSDEERKGNSKDDQGMPLLREIGNKDERESEMGLGGAVETSRRGLVRRTLKVDNYDIVPSESLRLEDKNKSARVYSFKGETSLENAEGDRRQNTRRTLSKKPSSKKRKSTLLIQSPSSAINFLLDVPKDMTLGRRTARRLSRWKCYNPHSGQNNVNGDTTPEKIEEVTEEASPPPILDKAWAHFEHVILPRYIVNNEAPLKICGRVELEKAEPGEDDVPTKLYSPMFTPLSQMGDFGIGIGLYFSTLVFYILLLVLAGAINIPNLIYFSSEEYSKSQSGIKTLLKGTAYCTDTSWVPCPTCTYENFKMTPNRLLKTNTNLTFALKNNCDGARINQGMVHWSSIIFVTIGMILSRRIQKRQQTRFDEDEQTAQDYSVHIHNPPPDAHDPDEWKKFFESSFEGIHVTCCTVAINNDRLLRALVERKERLFWLKLMLPNGTSLDDFKNLGQIAAQHELDRTSLARLKAKIFHPIGLFLDFPALYDRVVSLTNKIQRLAELDYSATNVFLTFETEAAQRQVLSALSVGTISTKRNIKSAFSNKDYLFRSEKVLDIDEAEEPSAIRWQDLNASLIEKFKKMFFTTICALVGTVLIAFLVFALRKKNERYAAIAISVTNSLFPMFCMILTNLESHHSESGKQTSLYVKIAFFRCVNTAIVIQLTTPFLHTLNAGESPPLIESVYKIFFADIVTTNGILLLDFMGLIHRHILGPRAQTQEAMNIYFQGTFWNLAERYTNMTKIVFLALYYSAIYPSAFFMSFLALSINYAVDKYCLMRYWATAPKIGTKIFEISQGYFVPCSILAMAILSSYWWSAFPMDNLCVTDSPVGSNYTGSYFLKPNWSQSIEVMVNSNDTSYKYCTQNVFKLYDKVSFPILPRLQSIEAKWMTQEQEHVVRVFGWTSVAVLITMFLRLLLNTYRLTVGFFKGVYKPDGRIMGTNFSDVATRSTYIPEIKSYLFPFPLIACAIDDIDEELFEWECSDKPYEYFSLFRHAEEILLDQEGTRNSTKIFSKIKHWPPI